METRKISFCIPYYNRATLVMETLKYPLVDDRIDEIIIVDDCSPQTDYEQLVKNTYSYSKIKVYRNVQNFYVQHNKRNCIYFAKNEWVITFDNDNVLDKSFIDKIFAFKEWDSKVIYHPSFAAPHFDYRIMEGIYIDRKTLRECCKHNIFVTLLNTNNYFVNKDEYLNVYQYGKEIRGSDGIYNSYNWLKAGNKIHIVPELTYQHRVHDSSVFLSETQSNMEKIYYWLEQIKAISI